MAPNSFKTRAGDIFHGLESGHDGPTNDSGLPAPGTPTCHKCQQKNRPPGAHVTGLSASAFWTYLQEKRVAPDEIWPFKDTGHYRRD
jgi:hypothetical protein